MVIDAVLITVLSLGKVNDSCQLLGVTLLHAFFVHVLRQLTDFNFHIEAFLCRPMLKTTPNSGH